MPVINDPTVPANIARVGNVVYVPKHQVAGPFPAGNGGSFRCSMTTGTLSAAITANQEFFQFRYTTGTNRVCLVYGISVSASMNVAAAGSSLLVLRASFCRFWTGIGTSGTRATMTGNNNKMWHQHNTSEVNDIGISVSAALGQGTKTFDSQDIGQVSYSTTTALITARTSGTLVPKTNLLGEFTGGLASPLLLTDMEGFVIRNGSIGEPNTMTWNMSVDVAWTEVDAF